MIKNRSLTTITGLLLLSASLLSIFAAAHLAQQSINERIESNARLIANVVHESRKLYSDEVVNRIRDIPAIEISNRYRDYSHGIPNPATFTILLGARLTEKNAANNVTIRIYSDLPFYNRKHRKLDSFSKEAIKQTKTNPDQAYKLISVKNGVDVFRYAEPMIMQKSCVDCHAVHPDSPKKDWAIGEVRGVLEISQPISNDNQSFKSIYLTRSFLTTIAIFIIVAIIIMLFRNAREKSLHIDNVKKSTEQLQKEAMTDVLTGIANRRNFDISLQDNWRNQQLNERPLSIGFIDIDYFKQYNDTLGHTQGDNCLKQVTLCISQQLNRPIDLVARYGGEEFALLLPDTNYQGCVLVIENLRQAINNLNIPHPDSPIKDHVTVSLGSITIEYSCNLSIQTAMKKADEALYEAKANGRNQAVCKHL